MTNDQPAQIDCRQSDCIFYKGAGKCSNISPALTLNTQGTFVCWSKLVEKKEPSHEEIRQLIEARTRDLVSSLLYYDRKEDEELDREQMEQALQKEIMTREEINQIFTEELFKALEAEPPGPFVMLQINLLDAPRFVWRLWNEQQISYKPLAGILRRIADNLDAEINGSSDSN